MKLDFSRRDKKFIITSIIVGAILFGGFRGIPAIKSWHDRNEAKDLAEEIQNETARAANSWIGWIDHGTTNILKQDLENSIVLDFDIFRKRRAQAIMELHSRLNRVKLLKTEDSEKKQKIFDGIISIVVDYCPLRFRQHKDLLVQDTKDNYIFLTTLQKDVPSTQPAETATNNDKVDVAVAK